MGNLFSVRGDSNTHDEENYVRFGKAIVGIGTSILQQVLETYIPSSKITFIVRSNSNLRLNQKQILLINQASVVGFKDFDITLCYTLLRNVSVPNMPCFPIPTRGWGNQPLATDVTLSDDIERLRILRNEMFCHLPSPAIPIMQFTYIWQQLRDICERINATYPNGRNFLKELSNLETCLVTRVEWSSLVRLVEKNREYDLAIKDIAKRLDTLHDQERNLKAAQRAFNRTLQSVIAQTDSIDEEVKRHNDSIEDLNDGVQRHSICLENHSKQLGSLDIQFKYHKDDMMDIKKLIQMYREDQEPDVTKLKERLIEFGVQMTKANKEPSFQTQEEDVPAELSFTSVFIRENPKYTTKSKTDKFGVINKRVPLQRHSCFDDDYTTNADPCDIFEVDGDAARNIYMLGAAAHGKTAFCVWILKKWSNMKQIDGPLTHKFDKWERALQEFDFVFLIQLRDVNPNLTSVIDMICDEVCKSEKNLTYAVRHVLLTDRYRNLIIIDGLGEWDPNDEARDLLSCKSLPDIRVSKSTSCLISMRPWILQTLSKVIKINDRVLEIEGIKASQIGKRLRYVLLNHFDLKEDSSKFVHIHDRILNDIRGKGIEPFMEIPIIALHCLRTHIYLEDKQLDSMTIFYVAMIDQLLERAFLNHEKHEEKDNIKTFKVPAIFSGTSYIKTYFSYLLELGEMACLLYPFVPINLIPDEIDSNTIHIALCARLIKTSDAPFFEPEDEMIYFLHKSVSDFLAAIYIIADDSISNEFCNCLSDVSSIEYYSDIIKFICGMSPSLGSVISHHVVTATDKDKDIIEYRESGRCLRQVINLYKLQCGWYKELESVQLSNSVAFHISDVYLSKLPFRNECGKEALKLTKNILSDKNVDIRSLCLNDVSSDTEDGITNTDLNKYLSCTYRTRSLVKLEISRSYRYKDRYIHAIHIPTLKSLYLGNVNVEYEDTINSQLLKGMIQLRSLKLCHVNLGDREIGISADMSQLKTITLKSVDFSAAGWERFISSLSNVQHEVHVYLDGKNIDSNLITMIRSSIYFKENLFHVEESNNIVDMNGTLINNHIKLHFTRKWPISQPTLFD